jgi:two-component system phosphate regulon sensor histidine kinase PhoR
MKKKKPLIWQLYPSYVLITILSLVAATWFATSTLRQFLLEQYAQDLEARARLLEEQVVEYLDKKNEQGIDQLCKRSGSRGKTRITVISPSGKVMGDSQKDPGEMDNHVDRPEVLQALSNEMGVSTRYSRTLQQNMMYVGIPLKHQRETIGVLRTALPLTSVEETLKSIQLKIVIGGVFVALLAALVSLFISRRITRPIEEIRRGAEHFSRGDLNYRLHVSGSEEIENLSKTMEKMAEDLDTRINTITRQRSEMEAVFSSMVEGVLAVDIEERVISINRAASEMLFCDPSGAEGMSIQEISRNTALQEFVREAVQGVEPIERDIVIYAKGERLLNARGMPLLDGKKRQVGAVIVLDDVTRFRQLESIRRDFVANVSHEIKTPITAIKASVETLKDGALKNPKDANRFLDITKKHVDRLEAIIEDILSLSRIERGVEKQGITLREGPIKHVLTAALSLCESQATAKHIHLDLACDNDLTSIIDPDLLEQAIVNLLDNAIKYSDEKSTIQAKAFQTDNEIVISVHDKGCGIAEEHLPRIFERFYRVDKARSRKVGGTGLGLAIVKHIAQAHGGHVSVESTVGKGSTFAIYLPVKRNQTSSKKDDRYGI